MLCVEENVSASNENLVLRLQSGEESVTEQLISQNEGWISKLATELCTQYDRPDLYEDLQQEGRIALLESARSYSAERGAKFMSYAGSAIRNAMLDYAAHNFAAFSLPVARFQQLRRASYLCAATQEDASQAQLMERLCQEMSVSPKVAAALLMEHYAVSASANLGDGVSLIRCGRDPAAVYETKLKVWSVFQALERLSPREQLLIKQRLGIGAPDGKGMTFEELAIRLNYNDPSGAEKAYKAAIARLRELVLGGKYGDWLSAKRAVRDAERQIQPLTG